MARLTERHEAGASGAWFVDSRCIDCDAARQVAPGLIVRNPSDGNSLFARQPETPEEVEKPGERRWCPTRSVGHATLKRPATPVFPHDLGDGVYRLGHTRGSVLYLVDGHLLFTGDSLSWNPNRQALHAFRQACWYSWEAQTASLGRFADSEFRFDRLFAGHGWSHDAAAETFQRLLQELVERMASM